jgi:Rieske Fe-S protein
MRAATLALGGAALGTILEGCSSSSSPTAPSAGSSLPVLNATATAGGTTLAIDPNSPLAQVGGAALVETTVNAFLVSRTAASAFVTLSAICTHQTCTITRFSSPNYVCPCHDSMFDVNGRVLSGPATSPLRQYTTQFDNGVLTIST